MIRRMLVGTVALVFQAAALAQTAPAKPAAAPAKPAAAPVAAAAPSVAVSQAQPLVTCMRANVPQSVQVKEVELTARDRSGGERL
ncbi:MAG TPA: hypothetical protein VLI06_04600, partial [Solimonas sp.]|nr:hypothetical protein [Solimonas sp.]